MAGKRTIKVHGEKIAEGRANLKLDQVSFAGNTGVSVRTLQRAENGMSSPSTIELIANALKVNPEELIWKESLVTSNNIRNDGYGTLILKPLRSFKDVQKLILSHRPNYLDLNYQVNPPQPELVDMIAAVIKEIQRWVAMNVSGAYEALEVDFDSDTPPDYAERFKKDMAFTKNLVDLWDGGIFVFAGHYIYRELNWVPTPDPYNEKHMWETNMRDVTALRFFDDNNMAQNNQVSERVYYGLSAYNWGKWANDGQEDIRWDGSTKPISADNQVDSDKIPENISALEQIFSSDDQENL